MTAILTMANGDSYSLAGWSSKISVEVNAARGSGKLIPLERDRIPTGQLIHIDPDLVMSIKDER